MITRRTLLTAAAALPVLAATGARAEETHQTVEVAFWDNPDMAMQDNLGWGMGGDMSKANMGFKLSTDTVKAGDVTFVGTNQSKDIVHEMIVAPLPADGKPLPYNKDDNEVDEDAAGALGEISELDPGATGKLSLHLAAGKYILFCNVSGHYMGGMWAILTVS